MEKRSRFRITVLKNLRAKYNYGMTFYQCFLSLSCEVKLLTPAYPAAARTGHLPVKLA